MQTSYKGWTYTDEGKLIKPNGTVCSRKPNTGHGYLPVKVKGKSYLQHRIIFFLHNGYWANEVDHIDRDKVNNAPINLRDVDHSTNQHNRDVQKNNTSGVKGVSFHTRYKKWVATISIRGKARSKTCDSKQQAIEQRKLWEEELS